MSNHLLNDQDFASLRVLLGQIIPASEEFDVPGANDKKISVDVLKSNASNLNMIKLVLSGLDELSKDHGSTFGKLSKEAATDVARVFQEKQPDIAGLLSVMTAQCYYRDDRVMRALNMAVRPPFPLGFDVEEGDWGLLDPIKDRAPFWRRA
jgi:hypothetical protein